MNESVETCINDIYNIIGKHNSRVVEKMAFSFLISKAEKLNLANKSVEAQVNHLDMETKTRTTLEIEEKP